MQEESENVIVSVIIKANIRLIILFCDNFISKTLSAVFGFAKIRIFYENILTIKLLDVKIIAEITIIIKYNVVKFFIGGKICLSQ